MRYPRRNLQKKLHRGVTTEPRGKIKGSQLLSPTASCTNTNTSKNSRFQPLVYSSSLAGKKLDRSRYDHGARNTSPLNSESLNTRARMASAAHTTGSDTTALEQHLAAPRHSRKSDSPVCVERLHSPHTGELQPTLNQWPRRDIPKQQSRPVYFVPLLTRTPSTNSSTQHTPSCV